MKQLERLKIDPRHNLSIYNILVLILLFDKKKILTEATKGERANLVTNLFSSRKVRVAGTRSSRQPTSTVKTYSHRSTCVSHCSLQQQIHVCEPLLTTATDPRV